jgi:ATP-dependent DNA helicase RecG
MYVREKGRITNKNYQELVKVSRQTASRYLIELVRKGIFEQIGSIGTGTYYKVPNK